MAMGVGGGVERTEANAKILKSMTLPFRGGAGGIAINLVKVYCY